MLEDMYSLLVKVLVYIQPFSPLSLKMQVEVVKWKVVGWMEQLEWEVKEEVGLKEC